MAQNATRDAEKAAQEAQEKLEKFGKTLNKQANIAREKLAEQLHEAEQRIRQEIEKNTLDDDARAQVDNALSRLNEVSSYLQKHTVEQIEEQATQVVRENVWRNLIIAFIFGLVLGLLLRGRD
jgi:ElaB/YqjD/DUF883 family membrane-anchored ribosome-binding protein